MLAYNNVRQCLDEVENIQPTTKFTSPNFCTTIQPTPSTTELLLLAVVLLVVRVTILRRLNRPVKLSYPLCPNQEEWVGLIWVNSGLRK